jgi:hypothetical protein
VYARFQTVSMTSSPSFGPESRSNNSSIADGHLPWWSDRREASGVTVAVPAPHLDERQRHLLLAAEANEWGRDGVSGSVERNWRSFDDPGGNAGASG